MKKESKLSVVLAVYNEESNLARCLDSVKDIADEMIVVDGGSTDATQEIAKSFGARLIVTENVKMFHTNKQKALDAAKYEWILQLDADEVVSKELSSQILAVVRGGTAPFPSSKQQKLFSRHASLLERRDGSIGSSNGEVVAYMIPRLNYFLGGWLKHGGVYPDAVIRLIKNGKAYFPQKDVHEQMKIDGKIGWLTADLKHYADPTMDRYMMRANRYTSLTAEKMKRDGVSKNIFSVLHYMFFKPFAVFCSLYFRHKGLLDGYPGFVWALFSGLHFPMAYMKYWESSRE
jgi:glycosyltransferase involved in cell wall biosynthesis